MRRFSPARQGSSKRRQRQAVHRDEHAATDDRSRACAIGQRVRARLIEAPVLGTIPQVQAGTLFAMVGGKPGIPRAGAAGAGKADPAHRPYRRKRRGYAMKLAANLGLGAYIQAVADRSRSACSKASRSSRWSTCCRRAQPRAAGSRARPRCSKGNKGDMTLDIRTLRKDIMSAVATGRSPGCRCRWRRARWRRCRRRSTAITATAISPNCQSSFAKPCCKIRSLKRREELVRLTLRVLH